MTFKSKWSTAPLGSVVLETQYGTSIKANDQGVGVPVLRMNNITYSGALDLTEMKHVEMPPEDIEQYSVRRGDLLFNRTNSQELVGKMGVWNRDETCAFAGYLVRLRLKPEDADPGFISAWFNTKEMKSLLRTRAKPSINMSNINATEVLKFPVVLPPLPEQKRIAEILGRAEALRAKRRAALAQLDTLTQSIFLDLFGDPRKNRKAWNTMAFSEACESRLGKMLDQKHQTGLDKRPYLRNANVQWFRLDLTEVFEMDFDAEDREEFRLQKGDVLICEGGEPGRAAIWKGEMEECYFQKALHRVRPRGDKILPIFIVWLLWFMASRGQLGDHVTSATIAHLTGEKLKALPILVPPLPLQHEFARRAAAVEKLKTAHRQSLAELDALFASLQHRAFRGEL